MKLLNTESRSGSFIILLYLGIEAALFIISEIVLRLMGSELIGEVRYAAIVLNLLIAGIWFFRYGLKDVKDHSNTLIGGLLMTAVADIFLTLIGTENFYLHGFICFCIVELIYALYLKTSAFGYLIRFNIYIIALIVFVLTGKATVVYCAGLLNIVLVLTNALSAWATEKMPTPLYFKLGLTLFFLCDISVVGCGATTGTAYEIFYTLAWLFYAPSQILITLSYVKSIEDAEY